ncbi:uncharacterized protein LOC143445776 isoform X1 [Clavelina lepadiformis]|uniref:uncharacterized protein LOC143445776 isoform X1 n=1 Tax=Clavelina lepadiformis TaxID=159417 RepID=UPI004042C8B4
MKLELDLHCLLIIYGVLRAAATTTISTAPPYNPLATGFNNLIVTAQFPTPTSNTDSCFWFYGGELDSGGGASFYSGAFGCDFPAPGTYDSITCTEQTIDGTNHTITILTITQPLVAGNINIEVRCIIATDTPGPITRTVQNCPPSLPYDVVITSSSQTYQASGMFSCPSGDLFYSNGTALPSSDTTCLVNAKWSGQDNLQCWMAPSVTLASSSIDGNKLTVVEGNDLTLACNYDDVIPAGDTSRFYIGGNRNPMNQGEPFILFTLQRTDNNKVVSCQAVTPYTDLYPASGRSSEYTLNVLYVPDTVNIKAVLTDFTIPAENGYLLRSDENLTMQCIYSEANPPANCNFTFHMTQSNTVSSVSGCSISYNLDQSSLVSCTAGNIVGSRSSDNQTITVVPAQRILHFNVDGANVTDNNATSYLGQNVTFSCSIGFSDELKTSFYFFHESNNIGSEQSFDLTLKPSDTGNYSCTSMDSFGNYSASIYLDVLYAATQDEIPICNWNLNETGICYVMFFSNPNSQFVSLSKDEQTVASDDSMTITPTGDQGEQTFTFNRKNVENSDNGRYELTVKSSSSGLFLNSVLYFDIEVVDNTDGNGEPPGTPGLSTGAIAGIIAGVVAVIVCAAGYGVYRWRNGSQKKNGSRPNEMYPTGSGNRTLTDQLGYIDVTANDSAQISSDNQRNYEVVGPAEDENGYLAVNGSTTGHLRNRASNSQLETVNAGYVVVNGEESNAESNNQGNATSSSKRYENIEGAYDDVITAPRAHTEVRNHGQQNGSRRYENVEGPYDEINNS